LVRANPASVGLGAREEKTMRIATGALFLGFTLVGSVHAQAIGPAPKGPAEQVAMAAIKDTGHPCGTVVRAARTDNGGIRAVCSNGEAYRVFTVNGQLVAMKCSAAAKLGVSGC
jgi:hypothetical protein